jgi:hypothetical protein
MWMRICYALTLLFILLCIQGIQAKPEVDAPAPEIIQLQLEFESDNQTIDDVQILVASGSTATLGFLEKKNIYVFDSLTVSATRLANRMIELSFELNSDRESSERRSESRGGDLGATQFKMMVLDGEASSIAIQSKQNASITLGVVAGSASQDVVDAACSGLGDNNSASSEITQSGDCSYQQCGDSWAVCCGHCVYCDIGCGWFGQCQIP